MSYFMTIAGVIPTDELNCQVELLSADLANAYIYRLKDRLEALDGPNIQLVHDMETDTSDIIVADLENALLEKKSITELPLFLILKSCFKNGVNFRIWLADNDMNALINNCVEVNDMASTLEAIKTGSGAWWHAR